MSTTRTIFALAILSVGNGVRAAESPGDLAIHARSILKKHCVECHDGKAGSRSSLQILDYSQLTSSERKLPPFVKKGAPLASQVVEFIEDGSMPPGNRPKLSAEETAIVKAWTAGGAAGYPRQFDDSFAHAVILADLEAAKQSERASYRYFSLHHLLEKNPAIVGLLPEREAFRKALNGVSKREFTSLKSIDPTETIFRVDLRELGWSAKPFHRIGFGANGVPKDQPASDTIFDILLLEYPFANMPPATKEAEAIVESWLRPIEQIRPIIYMQADWFAERVNGTPLKADFNRLIGPEVKARGFEAPERKRPDSRPDDLPPIAVRPGENAIPIVPIDAWYAADYQPKTAPKIDISILNEDSKPTSKFKVGDRLKMEIRSSQDASVEMILVNPDRSITPVGLGASAQLQANVAKDIIFGGQKQGLRLGDDSVGRQRFIVYAAPRPFPKGEILAIEDDDAPLARFVHPFYQLAEKIGDPPKFDASNMARKSAIFEVTK